MENYQKKLETILDSLDDKTPSLLLHSCCAPCSSYVMEYLSSFFAITVFYYNPNILSSVEYNRRLEEQKRLISEIPAKNPINFMAGDYDPKVFLSATKGMYELPEGGARCFVCYELRLKEAARIAKENGFDYFTTTLSISPHKNAEKLNEIGEKIGLEFEIPHLPADFKKKNGYKRSIELSKEYSLYRQDYCGCNLPNSLQ